MTLWLEEQLAINKMLYEQVKRGHCACPEIRFPDFYGGCTTKRELLANEKSNQEICKNISKQNL